MSFLSIERQNAKAVIAIEDKRILLMLNNRDEQALTATAAKYGALCRSVALDILGNEQDVEECINDALLAIWNAIPPARPRRLAAFLGAITRNLAIDRYRLTHRKKDIPGESIVPLDELKEDPQDSSSGPAAAQDTEISELIAAFLRTQSERKVAVFVARYYHEEPVEEIARTLSLPKNTVLSDLHNAGSGLCGLLQMR